MSSNPDQELTVAATLREAGLQLQAGKSGKLRAAKIPPDCDVKAVDWKQLLSLPHLARFEAAGSAIGDEQIKIIMQLPALTQLDLTQAAEVTDASREPLQAATQLKILKLTGTSMSTEAVRQMRKTMINTRIIYLS